MAKSRIFGAGAPNNTVPNTTMADSTQADPALAEPPQKQDTLNSDKTSVSNIPKPTAPSAASVEAVRKAGAKNRFNRDIMNLVCKTFESVDSLPLSHQNLQSNSQDCVSNVSSNDASSDECGLNPFSAEAYDTTEDMRQNK